MKKRKMGICRRCTLPISPTEREGFIMVRGEAGGQHVVHRYQDKCFELLRGRVMYLMDEVTRLKRELVEAKAQIGDDTSLEEAKGQHE